MESVIMSHKKEQKKISRLSLSISSQIGDDLTHNVVKCKKNSWDRIWHSRPGLGAVSVLKCSLCGRIDVYGDRIVLRIIYSVNI
jgi:hypothetical protein